MRNPSLPLFAPFSTEIPQETLSVCCDSCRTYIPWNLADFAGSTADPDRSNPTRPRWERPLDTIRSFEAAIDGVYTRKNSSAGMPIPSMQYPVIHWLTQMAQTGTEGSTMGMNRRSSYMGGMFVLSVSVRRAGRCIFRGS